MSQITIKMAKAIKKYDNGLNIRFLKTPKKFYITFGVDHVKIDRKYSVGFSTFEEAEKVLLNLRPENNFTSHDWVSIA